MVAALSCRKSTQKRRLPSFFLTIITGEAHGLLDGRMTSLASICWTCAITSRRTAVFCRWRSRGPCVSIVCSSSGVLPRSSSPWLKTSLNSRNRSFSCCCWSGERRSGKGDRRSGPGREAVRGVSARVTTSRTPIFCPECSWRGSGRWLWEAIQSSGPLESDGMPSQKPAERRWDRIKRPRRATGCGNERGEPSLGGCLQFAAAEHG